MSYALTGSSCLSQGPEKAGSGGPFLSLLRVREVIKGQTLRIGAFFVCLFTIFRSTLSHHVMFRSSTACCKMSPVKYESICCRRYRYLSLESSSSMPCASAFILQGEKSCCLFWLHYKVEFIHGHKAPSDLCIGRSYKRTTNSDVSQKKSRLFSHGFPAF